MFCFFPAPTVFHSWLLRFHFFVLVCRLSSHFLSFSFLFSLVSLSFLLPAHTWLFHSYLLRFLFLVFSTLSCFFYFHFLFCCFSRRFSFLSFLLWSPSLPLFPSPGFTAFLLLLATLSLSLRWLVLIPCTFLFFFSLLSFFPLSPFCALITFLPSLRLCWQVLLSAQTVSTYSVSLFFLLHFSFTSFYFAFHHLLLFFSFVTPPQFSFCYLLSFLLSLHIFCFLSFIPFP